MGDTDKDYNTILYHILHWSHSLLCQIIPTENLAFSWYTLNTDSTYTTAYIIRVFIFELNYIVQTGKSFRWSPVNDALSPEDVRIHTHPCTDQYLQYLFRTTYIGIFMTLIPKTGGPSKQSQSFPSSISSYFKFQAFRSPSCPSTIWLPVSH